ncbi:hypothetical protein AAKU64_004138 [Undibacterium sp. GrIS 1.8]|uniref:hypothetical protein n=1 Tax=Undibacterium sp. GrIS 1.8 TaxID=3143934 RepID=UPI003398E076
MKTKMNSEKQKQVSAEQASKKQIENQRTNIMTTKKLKISEFRRAVQSMDWSRNDLGGATTEEFIRMDVKTRLGRHIEAVTALIPLVPVRFAADIEEAQKSIGYANKCISRWVAKVAASQAPKVAPAQIVAPVLYLVH